MRKSTRTVLVGAAALPLAILTPGLAFADEAAPAAGPLDAATGALPAPVADAVGTVAGALPAPPSLPNLPVPLPVDPNAVAGTVLGALPLPAAPAADSAAADTGASDDSGDSGTASE
ncbi:hypothetical protein [Pseudonocardia sp. D17]|uniref:hypothetical protein n=1 Tax=Pseudonocardia sp. D17 TaxID=882661 RepID=UPI002B38B914|nr:hypothetical protein PSD17_23950 [Pseudonocardia sp. D17]